MAWKAHIVGAALIMGYAGYTKIQTAANYQKVEATVVWSKQECSISNLDSKLVTGGSSSAAYMDCAEAPEIAAQHGYDEEDIHPRTRVKYEYISPVDGSRQTGFKNEYGNTHNEYVPGYRFEIRAHKDVPAKSKA